MRFVLFWSRGAECPGRLCVRVSFSCYHVMDRLASCVFRLSSVAPWPLRHVIRAHVLLVLECEQALFCAAMSPVALPTLILRRLIAEHGGMLWHA